MTQNSISQMAKYIILLLNQHLKLYGGEVYQNVTFQGYYQKICNIQWKQYRMANILTKRAMTNIL